MSSLLRSIMIAPSSVRYLCRPGVLDQSKSAIFSRVRFCSNKQVAETKSSEPLAEDTVVRKDMAKDHSTTDLKKRILVHFKYYPNIESVPERVPSAMMAKALSQARIKVSILMMLTAIVLCFLTAWYGRAHRYEYSLHQVNMRRHELYKMGETGRGGRLALIFHDEPAKEEKKEE